VSSTLALFESCADWLLACPNLTDEQRKKLKVIAGKFEI